MFDLPNLPLIQLLLRYYQFSCSDRSSLESGAFALQPQQFPCDFCTNGSDAASNITDFCVLKGIWANAFNVTSIETVAGWMENNEFCEWVGVTCDQGGGVVALQLASPNVPNVFIDNLGNLEKLSTL